MTKEQKIRKEIKQIVDEIPKEDIEDRVKQEEQEEAIERLNRFKTIEILYSNTFAMHIEQLKTLQEDIETVLSMLKEKDREINRKSSTIKALQCALHERTEERDRKDNIITRQNKQIDVMEEFIYAMWCDYPMKITKRLKNNGFDDKGCGTCESKEKNCLDCLEQYFKSKAEKED